MEQIQVKGKSIPGIANIGNSCYADSLLPILFSLPTFRETILNSTSQDPIILELQNLFIDMSKDGVSSVAMPENLISLIKHNIGNQEDAEEYFHKVLDLTRKALFFEVFKKQDDITKQKIIDRYNSKYGIVPPLVALDENREIDSRISLAAVEVMEKEKKDVKLLKTFMHLTNFSTKQMLYSADNKDVREITEELSILQLPLVGNSLNTSLDGYFAEEVLTGDNQYDFGDGKKDAKKRNTLREPFPPVLFVEEKRYTYDSLSKSVKKIETAIETPEIITVGGKRYQLFAVQRQYGGMNGGHYISDIKTNMDAWKHFNDSSVSDVPDVIKDNKLADGSSPYILAYVDITQIPSLFPDTISVPKSVAERIQSTAKLVPEVKPEQKPEDSQPSNPKMNDPKSKSDDEDDEKPDDADQNEPKSVENPEDTDENVITLDDFTKSINGKEIDKVDDSMVHELASTADLVAVEVSTKSIGDVVQIREGNSHTSNGPKSYVILPISDSGDGKKKFVEPKGPVKTVTVYGGDDINDGILDKIVNGEKDSNRDIKIPESISTITREEDKEKKKISYGIALAPTAEVCIEFIPDVMVIGTDGSVIKYEDHSTDPVQVVDVTDKDNKGYNAACEKIKDMARKFSSQGNTMEVNGKPITFRGKAIGSIQNEQTPEA